jgi:hypothetical protein
MYLYRRGPGAKYRVMHLTLFDPSTGRPAMKPLCGMRYPFNTAINVSLSQRRCKRCIKVAFRFEQRSDHVAV